MAQRTTIRGTPAAPNWSADWLASVESEERTLNHRICGAMTPNMSPCTLTSDHPSGRCRYHGGVPTVGPPKENQNARIHGLYARRLQRCGPHCPLWESCAFSGEDVAALPLRQRPICAYEREEYAALVSHYFKEDVDAPVDAPEKTGKLVWNSSEPKCHEPFLLHQLVMLTVMSTRAAAVLGQGTLTEAVEVDSPGYSMKSAKPGAALEAFVRIMREYRGLHSMIDTKKLVPPPPEPMGIGSRMRPLLLRSAGAFEESIVEVDEDAIRADEELRRREIAELSGKPSKVETPRNPEALPDVPSAKSDAHPEGSCETSGSTPTPGPGVAPRSPVWEPPSRRQADGPSNSGARDRGG